MLKKRIPLLIALLTGAIYVASIFIPRHPFDHLREDFSVWFDVIAAFAFILGGGSLFLQHITKISNKTTGWGYSVITILSFLIMLIACLFKVGNPEGWAGDMVQAESWGGFIYNNSFMPLQATMFSLLAFYVASASFRAFRAKNRDATVLLVSAFIILLGRTLVGTLATSWLPESLSFLQIPSLFNWIMNIPNTAGQRAMMIGIALGTASTSLKLILGIESSYLGREEQNK